MNFTSYYTRSAIRWVVFGQITVKLKRECSLFDFSARFSDANTLSQMFSSSRLDHKGLDKRARIGGGVTVQPPTKGVIASSHFSHECAGQSHYESRAEYQTVRMTSVVFFGTSGKVMRTRRIVRPAIRSTVNISRSKLMQSPGPVRIVIGVDGSPDANNCFHAAAQRSWPKGSEARVVVVPKPGPRIDMFAATVSLGY